MNNLNSVIIEGRVVREPELREPAKDFKVCSFPIAVSRYYKDRNDEWAEEVNFVDIEAFGKIAEGATKNCEKGREIRVVGRMKQERWKDKDEKSVSKLYVFAEHIEYGKKVSSKANASSSDSETTEVRASEEVPIEEDYEEAASF